MAGREASPGLAPQRPSPACLSSQPLLQHLSLLLLEASYRAIMNAADLLPQQAQPGLGSVPCLLGSHWAV